MDAADQPDVQPLTAKGRATRDRIVRAAADVILNDGLSALSMVNVRNAARVSGSQLGHYFGDKQALIRAVIARQLQVVLDFHRQPKLGGLQSFDDFERWIGLNMRYLRQIGYEGTPTYHALAGQLAKSDTATRETIAAGYRQWVELLEQAIERMKDYGLLVPDADPHRLAIVIVSAHQGGGTVAFTYREEWPHADAVRYAVNYLRVFAKDSAERTLRPPRRRRPASRPEAQSRQMPDDPSGRFTRKGLAVRQRIVDATAELMFERGVEGTSLEDVRGSAGVSGSQLTHYFEDKRDLTRQVIAARRDAMREFHTQQQFGALDSVDALQAWADACVSDVDNVYRRGGCVYGSLAAELLEADDQIHADLAAGYDQWIKLFHAGLIAMRRRGDLRAEADPRHLAVALVTAHQGGAMLTYTTGTPEPLTVAVNAAVDYVRSFTPRRWRKA